MRPRERTKLVLGPYQVLALQRGDRAACLLRDCDVVVTGWTDGRIIRWPCCGRREALIRLITAPQGILRLVVKGAERRRNPAS